MSKHPSSLAQYRSAVVQISSTVFILYCVTDVLKFCLRSRWLPSQQLWPLPSRRRTPPGRTRRQRRPISPTQQQRELLLPSGRGTRTQTGLASWQYRRLRRDGPAQRGGGVRLRRVRRPKAGIPAHEFVVGCARTATAAVHAIISLSRSVSGKIELLLTD